MNENAVLRSNFRLANDFGNSIHGEVRFCSSSERKPAVIICHSFMAFKDWGFFPYVAETLARAGFVAVTFNFSLNGVIEHGNRITDFSSFEKNNFSQELNDLNVVIGSVVNGDVGNGLIDPERIVLLGHSRGGGIAIVKTSTDNRVKGLVTWSAIATFNRWTDHQRSQWRSQGFLPLASHSTVSPLRLGIGLLDDLEEHSEMLNIEHAASRLSVPWLIMHGKADVTVSPKEAERLYASASKNVAEIVLLDGVGHLYHAATPNEDHYSTINHILEHTIHWMQRNIEE